MAEADRERWDVRHAAVTPGRSRCPRTGCGAGGPAARRRARALDVACGGGAVAVWLATHGFEVDAVDVSVGLTHGAELAVLHGVADGCGGSGPTWTRACPRRSVAGGYDVVVCQRFRDPALYPALAAALRPAGCSW